MTQGYPRIFNETTPLHKDFQVTLITTYKETNQLKNSCISLPTTTALHGALYITGKTKHFGKMFIFNNTDEKSLVHMHCMWLSNCQYMLITWCLCFEQENQSIEWINKGQAMTLRIIVHQNNRLVVVYIMRKTEPIQTILVAIGLKAGQHENLVA